MSTATTFDFHVLDVATRYAIRREEIASGKTPQKSAPQNELLKMLEYAKGKNNGKG